MLPISEFHFAFCGIATVAATLGYACARRAVLSLSPNESSTADVEAGPPEERSLKRKLDSDELDADADAHSRPMKRNRTPPTGIDQHETDEDFSQEWEVVVAPPPYDQVVGLRESEEPVQDKTPPLHEDCHTTEQDVTPAREPTPPAHAEVPPQPGEKGVGADRCTTPQPLQANLLPNEPDVTPVHLMTPPNIPARTEPVKAFSAFSGSSSPFTSYSNASGASPFALSGQSVRTTPAWRRDNEKAPDVFGWTSSPDALAPSLNDAVAPATGLPALLQSKNVFVVPCEIPAKTSACLTGEEDETLDAELKGVKLFVKRGRKEFTDGIYGHVKILARKATSLQTSNEDSLGSEAETNPRTRLLFRRDPLGQVSMNVGLCPAVRCHFDTAECILRVISMEQVKTSEQDSKEEIVIYALKPGRAQKADFQSFAKALCDHEGIKSRAVTGPTIPGSGVPAASAVY